MPIPAPVSSPMSGVAGWVEKKMVDPLMQILRRGTAPKQLAFSASLGVTLGIFPICGVTVFLCGLAIALLGSHCHAPTVMLANFVATPIELSLVIPFLRLGEGISGGPHFPLTADALKKVLTGQASREVLLSIVRAILGWVVAAPFILAVLYILLFPCFKFLVQKFGTTPSSPKRSLLNHPEVRLKMLDGDSKKMKGRAVSGKAIFILCVASFLGGSILTSRTWSRREKYNQQVDKNDQVTTVKVPYHIEKPAYIATNEFDHKRMLVERKPRDIMEEVVRTHQAIRSLDKTVSTLEMELAVARTSQTAKAELSLEKPSNQSLRKAFVVIGINTAFSSKKRRDSLRETWMPRGDKLKKLETEKGIVVRFVIGHSATPGGVLDRAIDAEDAEHKDFLRLNHVEGYHELSTKTRLYFSTVMSIWDADFYVKVDDDVHLNLGMLASTLARYRTKPRIYIGCMKSGPVLSQKGVKYHEPEFWKFGEEGNKYFRHATGQLYAISKDLAAYISINTPILHRYANEDVSLGAWLIGLEVEHIDDRSMCCGTPPDCEWKTQAGNVCVASFDWSCSGICKSIDRMKDVHNTCGEGDAAVWNVEL